MGKAVKELAYEEKFEKTILNNELSKALQEAEDLVNEFLNQN